MEPKRERTLYEISSSFFALVVIAFAVVGLFVTALGDDGPGSSGFFVCLLFLVLGLGRLYLGLERGSEGLPDPPPEPPAEPPSRSPVRSRPPERRRRP